MQKFYNTNCLFLKQKSLLSYIPRFEYSSEKLVTIQVKEKNEYLTRILMNNEKQRNSLGLNMIRELQNAIDTLDLNKCRVLVIGSTSRKIFSSGHNLKEFIVKNTDNESDPDHSQKIFKEFSKLCLVRLIIFRTLFIRRVTIHQQILRNFFLIYVFLMVCYEWSWLRVRIIKIT